MLIGATLVVSAVAGFAAALSARRLPARGWSALGLCALPPLGLYYLLGSC